MHHYNIIQGGFTALKTPLCLAYSPPHPHTPFFSSKPGKAGPLTPFPLLPLVTSWQEASSLFSAIGFWLLLTTLVFLGQGRPAYDLNDGHYRKHRQWQSPFSPSHCLHSQLSNFPRESLKCTLKPIKSLDIVAVCEKWEARVMSSHNQGTRQIQMVGHSVGQLAGLFSKSASYKNGTICVHDQ